ncbi:MAG: electron transfer flavoprotein subunit alpha/FixB family protein [Chlorobium sp.]|nr:MAG: electron transfer flavoprotein subunit alpha/FixB family protein [Chlorobium sp.]
MNKFLVFLEQREGIIKKSSIDIWNSVQELAAVQGNSILSGILVGPADLHQVEGSLFGDGAIFYASDEKFRLYNPGNYVRLVADTMKRESCTSLFFADTALSRDLAPKLSVCLQASLLSGCSIFDAATACGSCGRSVYSGLARASFVPERSFRIYTIMSRATQSSSVSSAHPVVIPLDQCSYIDGEELFPVVRRIVMHQGRPDVAEAAIIIAGGRGMGDANSFELLEKIALLLGGAVGASRQAVDEGWRPHSEQIGQTGKTVAPALYVACGISGAVQHLAGIGSARTVVAINTDPYAPIFDVADYGIVGDVHVVLHALYDALHDFLKRQ